MLVAFQVNMDLLAFLRRSLLGLLGAGLGLGLMAAVSRSDEVGVGAAAASGIVVHGAAEILRDDCRQENGALWLELPGGSRFQLITSTSDPAISNGGDGSFHPFDETQVRAALSQVRFPLAGLSAHVYLLPYPRRDGLNSVAGPHLILLSPGVLPLPAAYQHYEVIHELGHVVQYARMPDADEAGWNRYRALRGITDLSIYSADAPHANRPHEIFAEDFRALFGDALANQSGSIENASLSMPQLVDGLSTFMGELAGATAGTLAAFPNPARGAVAFRRGGGMDPGVMDVFDLAGRRVATLAPQASAGGWSWSWDGRDAHGRRVNAGVVLARVRGGNESALRLTLLR
jgi:hypothetical protein